MVDKPNTSKFSLFYDFVKIITKDKKISRLVLLISAVILRIFFSVEKISELIVEVALLFFLIEHILEVIYVKPTIESSPQSRQVVKGNLKPVLDSI